MSFSTPMLLALLLFCPLYLSADWNERMKEEIEKQKNILESNKIMDPKKIREQIQNVEIAKKVLNRLQSMRKEFYFNESLQRFQEYLPLYLSNSDDTEVIDFDEFKEDYLEFLKFHNNYIPDELKLSVIQDELHDFDSLKNDMMSNIKLTSKSNFNHDIWSQLQNVLDENKILFEKYETMTQILYLLKNLESCESHFESYSKKEISNLSIQEQIVFRMSKQNTDNILESTVKTIENLREINKDTFPFANENFLKELTFFIQGIRQEVLKDWLSRTKNINFE